MPDNDAVGTFLGPFGKWQLRSTLLIYLVKIPSAWFMACLIFTAKSPTPGEIFCKPPEGITINNTDLWIKLAHLEKFDRVENEDSYDFCLINQNSTQNFLNSTTEIVGRKDDFVSCSTFEHHPIYFSLIHQYELFCSRDVLVPLTQSFHLLGVLIGGIIAHYLLKVISPRQTMLVGMVTQIFLGLATGYSPTYELHLFFRCSVAATCSLMCIGIMIGTLVTRIVINGFWLTCSIVSDITQGKYRVSAICLFEQFWSIGVILLPGIGSWWSTWGLVYVAISLPTVTLIILYFWIPDSPRWLLKHGRVAEAKHILLEAARVNAKKDFVEDDLDKQLDALSNSMKEASAEPSMFSIWNKDDGVRMKLFAAHIGWSIYLMLHFGLLLHVRAMGRDYLEVNTAIAGLSEIVGTFIGLYLILKTTRKWLFTSLLNIVASLVALSAVLVPETVPPFQRMTIYMASSMVCKVSSSTSLAIFITCMSEIVAKEKRKACNYSGVTCSRTIVMLAPFIGYFVIYGQLVPQIIMAVMNIFASIVIAACITTHRTIPKKAV